MNNCGKCQQPVPATNDVRYLEAVLREDPKAILHIAPQHLLPLTAVENGGVACQGSPSRAQYLPGQPRDERVQYPYHEEFEQPVREAHQKILAQGEKLTFD